MDIKEGDKDRVLVGVYDGKEGRVKSQSDAPKCIGVHVYGGDKMALPLTWFRPEEIKKV